MTEAECPSENPDTSRVQSQTYDTAHMTDFSRSTWTPTQAFLDEFFFALISRNSIAGCPAWSVGNRIKYCILQNTGNVLGHCLRKDTKELSVAKDVKYLTKRRRADQKGQTRHRQAQTVPGGWGSQNIRQLAHESGKVVSPNHRPHLHPRKYSWYSFLLQAE
jgi:hypothetical protein